MKRICHITTVHTRYDVRIFHKECKSLSKYYKVYLIVADGLGDEVKEEINIIDIGLRQSSRLKRARVDSAKALKKAKELDCDLYHFHDPELIKIGLKLKRKGKKVIYDTHEDLPRQIFGKPYIKAFLKPIISKFIERQENKAARKFDYICCATPFIRDRFLKINKNTVDINNYPIITEVQSFTNYSEKEKSICYVGGISKNRGVYELIESLQYSKITLNLAGKFEREDFKQRCMKSKGWKYVKYHGFLSCEEVANIYKNSQIGIVTLHPLVNYLDSLPVKMFEYMNAGLPVIASNFPFWKKIFNTHNCGINVNPLNSKEIAEVTMSLISNSDKSEEMGKNGQKAVNEKFNWVIEEKKLFNVYKKVLND